MAKALGPLPLGRSLNFKICGSRVNAVSLLLTVDSLPIPTWLCLTLCLCQSSFPQVEEFYSSTFGSKKRQKIEMPLAVPWSWTAAPIGSSWSSAWWSPPSSTQCSRPIPPSTGGESDAGIENGTSSTRTDAWNLHRVQPCHHIALLTAGILQNLSHQNAPLGLTVAHLAPTFHRCGDGCQGGATVGQIEKS